LADYAVVFTRSSRQELEALDSSLVSRIFPKIEGLSNHPRPKGSVKLQGKKNLWRIRVGDYRVVYAIYDEKRLVDVIAVRHRSKIYR
jgi:mRNA interferase RelE/StbE